MKITQKKQNLGCGIKIKDKSNKRDGFLFICGVPNAWGREVFCPKCEIKMRYKWDKEDRNSSDPRVREIYKLKKLGKLNY